MHTNTNKTYGVFRQLNGNTETIIHPPQAPVLRSRWRGSQAKARTRFVATTAALGLMLEALVAADPPAVTLLHTSSGPIAGGVAVGGDGVIYFTTLKNGVSNAKLTALNPNGTVKWTFEPLVGGVSYNMWAMPIIEPDELTILIGSDAGVFYSLHPNNGAVNWSYAVSAPAGTDKRIRSTAAYNVGPNQPNVYFHCNDGFLYAIKAVSGSFRWKKPTGNNLGNPASQGGPPPSNPDHLETWSSSPVISADGSVYVGSADGKVYAFNATTGAAKWSAPVKLGAPGDPIASVEATIAIGADGWLYAATRDNGAVNGGRVFAVNPAKAAVDPTQAIEWSVGISLSPPGVIASPVIDQGGFVYVAGFHDALFKLHPKTGVDPLTQQPLRSWGLVAKFCQTPALTQDGLLIVGTSSDASGSQSQAKRAIRAFHTDKPDSPHWTVPQVNGQDVGDFLGSPAIICSAAGTTYIADMDMDTGAGRLYQFNSGSTLMAGDWPTFQAGNRRLGKIKSYSYTITELPSYPGGNLSVQLGNLDPYNRAVGASGGSPCNNPADPNLYGVALWRNAIISSPGACGVANYMASARSINGFGDIVGYYHSAPMAWPNGAYDSAAARINLPIPGFFVGYAMDINTSSTIAGYVLGGSPSIKVFRWNKSGNLWVEQPISGPPLSDQAYAYAISDQGRIAGKARFTSPTSPWHAYVTPAGALSFIGSEDLGTLGGLESEAWDVKDDSGTVGWAQNNSALRRAFYIQTGGASLQAVNELPRLAGTSGNSYNSEAYKVNRLGQVVGKIQNDSGADRAFWWKTPGPGTFLTDLTTLPLDAGQTPQSLGWTLTAAVAINDGGVIIGYGTKSGVNKAWILYPNCQE